MAYLIEHVIMQLDRNLITDEIPSAYNPIEFQFERVDSIK